LTQLASGIAQTFDEANQVTNSGFGYDTRGNRTASPATLTGFSSSYGYDQADRLTSATTSCTHSGQLISAGYYHSVAVKSDCSASTWGYNADGELGNNSTANNALPVPVQGLTGVSALASGGQHNLALKSDGTVWGWGSNQFG